MKARVVGMHGDGAVDQNRLRARGADDDSVFFVADERIANIKHRAVLFFGDDFEIGDGGEQNRIPIHHARAAINKPLLVQTHKHFDDDFRKPFVHREALARPIARGGEAAHLRSDGRAGALFPFPSAGDKALARKGGGIDAFFFEFARDDHLGRDSGVVGAGLPQRVFAEHARAARERVHQRVLESVPHVQRAGDIGRRQHDRKRFAPAARSGIKTAGLLPAVAPLFFDRVGRVIFRQVARHCRRGFYPKQPPRATAQLSIIIALPVAPFARRQDARARTGKYFSRPRIRSGGKNRKRKGFGQNRQGDLRVRQRQPRPRGARALSSSE